MHNTVIPAEVQLANDLLCKRILKYWRSHPESNVSDLPVPRLRFHIETSPKAETNCFYTLSTGLILQGRKRANVDGQQLDYGKCTSLITAADTPSSYEIYSASPDEPHVSVALQLDPMLVSEIVQSRPEVLQKHGHRDFCHTDHLFTASSVSLDVIDCFARFVRLLEHPEQIEALAPLVERELVYLLLMSDAGAGLSQFFTQNSTANRISRTITWIRQNTGKPFDIDELADMANMTRSTFYRHFKMVTKLSPLQFHKRQCLYHAHHLMLTKGYSATQAAYEVGYASPNQFSREYKRVFGMPPKQFVALQSAISLGVQGTS